MLDRSTIAGRHLSSSCCVMMFNADLLSTSRTCDLKTNVFQTRIANELKKKLTEGTVGCATTDDGSWGVDVQQICATLVGCRA